MLWMAAADKVLTDKLAAHLEVKYGDQFEELAQAMIELMEARQRADRETRQKEEEVWQRMRDLFATFGEEEEEGE
jgi:hypothetical protein